MKLEIDKEGNQYLYEVSKSGRHVTKETMNKIDGSDFFLFAGSTKGRKGKTKNKLVGGIQIVGSNDVLADCEANSDGEGEADLDDFFMLEKKVLCCAAASNVPSFFATGGEDNEVSLFRFKASTKTITLLSKLSGPTDYVKCLSVSSDATIIACGTKKGDLHVWKSKKLFTTEWRKAAFVAAAHKPEVNEVCIDPENGSWLASGGMDWRVTLWTLGEDGSLNVNRSVQLGEHRTSVTNLAAFPSGNLLASSGRDGVIKLFDTQKKRSLADIVACDGVRQRS